MALATLIFALLASLALGISQCLADDCNCSPAMSFRANGDITQYGISRGSPEALESITACFWMSVPPKTIHRKRFSTPLSYAVKRNRNAFTFMLMPDLVLLAGGQRFKTGIHFDDGELHHVCATWESSSGNFNLYKDSILVHTVANVMTGETIPAGGTWVLGQDQDRVGGKFELRDAHKGTLTGVNIWNRVLCEYEIERVAKDCGSLIKGNYKSYDDFIMSHRVEFITPSCCPYESPASPF